MPSRIQAFRQQRISKPILAKVRQLLPPLSSTEHDAIEAGTVGWDAELFSGKPSWHKLLSFPRTVLSQEETDFLNGPVEELCDMLDDWKINIDSKTLPQEIWDFYKANRFFSMIIPKQYGGLEFSAYGHSQVVMKIATRSIAAAVTVMVPNSLGPAELLLSYGTEQQKDYYLPRLASCEEIPCFALTGPYSGSDAANMPDFGVICYGEHEGKETLGMKVTWSKRYITLSPIATLLGLAFKATDPDKLLGEETNLGITLALIPTDTPGVITGHRHYPCRQAFLNGPTQGHEVFIPMEWVIGGQDRIGQGWRMLMEALSAGRSISLPSLSSGAAKLCLSTSSAYARVRKQFGVPISNFEGVEEALAPIAANCYMLDAARHLTTSLVDQGQKPAVISAILKYHATSRMRESVNHAMDIHGGKAISDGPNNYLANVYYSLPVSITVEGANILTRSMIIFGQGAIRCHPYLQSIIRAAHNDDQQQGLEDFDRAFFAHIGWHLKNLGRALGHNLTGGVFASTPKVKHTQKYYRHLSRISASLAVTTDITLLLLGGKFKFKESLSARFGDVLSEMYLMSCVLKQHHDLGAPEEDLPIVRWCCLRGLHNIQESLQQILDNYPSKTIGWCLRRVIFPWGRRFLPPSDSLTHQVAELIQQPSPTRERLCQGIYTGADSKAPVQRLEEALLAVLAAEKIEPKLASLNRKMDRQLRIEKALEQQLINDNEAQQLYLADRLTAAVIAVDAFPPGKL